MSTYTNNLNLIKPGYDDDIDVAQLNNNMDVLDTQVSNAIAVNDDQNRRLTTLDNTVKTLDTRVSGAITVNDEQNRRLTTLENKTYPYLPLAGGTMTGAIKSNTKLVLSGGNNSLTIDKDGCIYNYGIKQDFIMKVSTVTNTVQNYKHTSDRATIRETVTKYSNGKQEIELIVFHTRKDLDLGVRDYTFSSPFVGDNITTLDGVTNTGTFEAFVDLTGHVVSCTTTSIGFETDNYITKYTIVVRGNWK